MDVLRNSLLVAIIVIDLLTNGQFQAKIEILSDIYLKLLNKISIKL